ncbi:MAG: hypothetical protein ISR82_03385 [Candidatus Marinimicrobia bacterium]|nr:hypothetical protein [Candidatus Neomarinimicrobiota bacterium]MBL7010246.1 hypothetical protein [Candidatus Neomarinimicrobiota bacterium]MBL7030661.1 hypothetical protein [Candidatus Neomarinimicrobiota bacterium]
MKQKIIIIGSLISLIAISCHPGEAITNKNDPSTCEGCHINKEALMKLAKTDDTGTSDGGGGG